jgi:hypothetical protein
MVVNTGLAIVTNRLRGSGAEPNYSAIGTGAGTAAVADTTLFTEVGSRVSGTSSQQTTSTTNDTYRVVATHTASGATAVTNAGLFDASTSGNLFVKADFAVVNLADGDQLQLTYNIQFDQG